MPANTALAQAFEKVGYDTSKDEFHVACVAALQRSGADPFRAQNDSRLRDALIRYLTSISQDMRKPQSGGQRGLDAQDQRAPAQRPTQPDGDKGQSHSDARPIVAPPSGTHRDGAGHSASDAQLTDARPAREPSVPKRGLAAMEQMAGIKKLCIYDTFMITLRQGGRQAIGEVHHKSLGRLARAAEKRGWVGSREAELLRLLDGKVKTFAHVPEDAKVRDIFKDDDVADLIGQATAVADRRALIHAVDGNHA